MAVVRRSAIVPLFALAACAGEPAADEAAGGQSAIIPAMQDGPARELPEVVQIQMPNGVDYCSGVLVAEDVVVTAAHCLLYDPAWTEWTVVASLAPGSPSRTGKMGGVVSRAWDQPANGDVGTLKLDRPIELPRYASLRDIGADADAGRSFRGVAVGRAREARDGALVKSKPLTITSARDHGYPTGLKTEYYSFGGDSGGGLFLLDAAGRPTHDVVGFERNPEPNAGVDYFTRVDAALVRLVLGGRGDTSRSPAPSPAPSASSTAR